MTAIHDTARTTGTDTVLGHLALHYAPGEERLARNLLQLLGCTLVDNGPAPGKDGFCTVLLGRGNPNYADNLMFLSCMKPEQVALEQAIRAAFGLDQTEPDPKAELLRQSVVAKPESISHIGLRYRSLEELEGVLAGLEAAVGPGGELQGRAELVKYRPSPGGASEADDSVVAARIATSPAFEGTEDPSFAKHWVQCFVKTDLCGYGILAFGTLFELDFVFDPFFKEPPDFRIRRRNA